MTALNPRAEVLKALCRVERGGKPEAFLRALEAKGKLKPLDRAFIREILLGVLRWRGRLDFILQQLHGRPLGGLPSPIRNVLRMGAYQLLFSDKVPPYAAVDESVELALTFGHRGTAGLVNAVLREVAKRGGGEELAPRKEDTLSYFVHWLSHPRWLVERWLKRWGRERAEEICLANNWVPPLTLRVNSLKTTTRELMAVLRREGLPVEPCQFSPQGLSLPSQRGPLDLTRSLAFRDGLFQVQDEGAMLIAPLLGLGGGEKAYDACAAPGGKALHLAELVGPGGLVVAGELRAGKLSRVRENCCRLGISWVKLVVTDASFPGFGGTFDGVLVDSPCSGLGVLRRHPEGKWLRGPADLRRLASLQLAILRGAASALKKGGRLLYCVCSNEPEETEEIVEEFLGRESSFRLEALGPRLLAEGGALFAEGPYFQALPGKGNTDGFFAALFIRG